MKRLAWVFVDRLAHFLEPRESDAVLGDFAESGEPPIAALRGILGLVLRRQAAVFSPLWEDWRAWPVLVLAVAPIALVLSIAASTAASGSAVYFWMYFNNWDWALLKNQGFWYTLRDSVMFLSNSFLLLACWSWSAGFLLGAVARRFLRMNARLFVVLLIFSILFAAPTYFHFWSWHVERPAPADPNGLVFALTFYRNLFPPLVGCAFIALPALYAMRRGAALRDMSLALRVFLASAAVLSLVVMSIQQPGFLFYLRGTWWLNIRSLWPAQLLPFTAYWPIAYCCAAMLARRRLPRRAP